MNEILSPAMTRSDLSQERLNSGGSADSELQQSEALKEMISASIAAQQANMVALIGK